VPENLKLKRKVITELDELAPESTIIASNSSSYGIFEILEGMSLKNNKRVMSAHCCR
jgi:3-hydroxyacyl-CoA dehydrogenase